MFLVLFNVIYCRLANVKLISKSVGEKEVEWQKSAV